MATLKQLLQRTRENLHVLREREAKYGIRVPLDLLNQISDHEDAIELIMEALSTELTEPSLNNLKKGLRPLLLANNVEDIDVDDVELERPRLPYEPETILIPDGPFTMGRDDGDSHEAPAHTTSLPLYKIGKFPITNAQYVEFMKQTGAAISPKAGWELARVGYAPPEAKLNHPLVGIRWDDAVTYCRWLSEQTGRAYRLPSEAEWEKAARGSQDQRDYPWGQSWDDQLANQNGRETTPVDHYPAQSPYGCFDMVGNVWEWTHTIWGRERAEPDFHYPYPPPNQPDGREAPPAEQTLHREYRVCRGGSFKDAPARLRCTTRARFAADTLHVRRGFRVVEEL